MRYLLLLLTLTIAYPAAAAPLDSGLFDDRYPVIEYAGTWSETSYTGAIAGAYQQADNIADTVSLETYANGLTLFFVFDPSGGAVDVCVDTDCVNVSTTGATATGKIELSNLADGLKEITIEKTDDSSVFNFDGVYIHPAGTDGTVETIDFEYNGETMPAQLLLEITSGDFLIFVLLAVIATFQVIQFALSVRSAR